MRAREQHLHFLFLAAAEVFGHLQRQCGALRGESALPARPLVSVVDDDESVRESLPDLLKVLGFSVRAFSSAEAFLASDCVGQTRCLLLDIAMPGMSGPALQRELVHRQQNIPIVFITAHSDEAVRQRVLKAGAIECLLKPFGEVALLGAINAALKSTE
jgi:FixJ family two-component response regulator